MDEPGGENQDKQATSDAAQDHPSVPRLEGIEQPQLKANQADKGEAQISQQTESAAAKFVRWMIVKAEKAGLHDWLIVIFTGVLTFVGVGQVILARQNSRSSSEQVGKIIDAADRIEDAADSFAGSSAHINKGMGDAVQELQAQADRMDAARKSSERASKQALRILIDNARTDQRAWIGVEDVKPMDFERNDAAGVINLGVTFTLRNYGHSAAEHVRVFPVLDATPWDFSSFPCDDSTAKNYSGDVIFPTQRRDFNHEITLTLADVESAFKRQNPQLGNVMLLRVRGCIEYTDTPTETKPHHTPFSYNVVRTDGGGFITPETQQVPRQHLNLLPDFIHTGPTD
jgi:hypothetical protein